MSLQFPAARPWIRAMRSSARSARAWLFACLLCAGVCAVSGLPARAQDSIWKGGTGNWTDNNWNGGVPDATHNALIDDGQTAINSVVTVNVANAAAATLVLDSGDKLNFAPVGALTVSGSTILDGFTGLDLGTFTLNGAARNNFGIQLSTESVTIAGHQFLIDEGVINGTGSLVNAGDIGGAGVISIASIRNVGLIAPADPNNPLVISGTAVNNAGGTIAGDTLTGSLAFGNSGALLLQNSSVGGGTLGGVMTFDNSTITNAAIEGQITARNGAAITNSTLGAIQQGFSAVLVGVTLTDGSALSMSGTVTNPAGSTVALVLGSNGGSGATISGSGTLDNESSIFGTGQISPDILNNGSITVGVVPTGMGGFGGPILGGSGTLQLNGAVDNTNGIIQIASGAQLDLNGARISGGQIIAAPNEAPLSSLGAILSAENGASLTNVAIVPEIGIGPAPSVLTLTSGSNLGIGGNVTISNLVTLTLNGGGASLSGTGTLVNLGTIDGAGSINVPIANSGQIAAFFPGATLALSGNVTNPGGTGSIRVDAGATLTMNSITVASSSVTVGAESTFAGTGTVSTPNFSNSGTVAPGLNGPGLLRIVGNYTQFANLPLLPGLDFALAGGQAGEYSQLDVIGFADFTGGSAIEAEFVNSFDPLHDCPTTFGVCDSFDVVSSPLSILGFSNLAFDLPTLDAGLQWQVENLGNEIVLEILGASPNGGGGGGGGGNTPTPEPGTLALFGAGLLTSAFQVRKLRRTAR